MRSATSWCTPTSTRASSTPSWSKSSAGSSSPQAAWHTDTSTSCWPTRSRRPSTKSSKRRWPAVSTATPRSAPATCCARPARSTTKAPSTAADATTVQLHGVGVSHSQGQNECAGRQTRRGPIRYRSARFVNEDDRTAAVVDRASRARRGIRPRQASTDTRRRSAKITGDRSADTLSTSSANASTQDSPSPTDAGPSARGSDLQQRIDGRPDDDIARIWQKLQNKQASAPGRPARPAPPPSSTTRTSGRTSPTSTSPPITSTAALSDGCATTGGDGKPSTTPSSPK